MNELQSIAVLDGALAVSAYACNALMKHIIFAISIEVMALQH
jgi:hypothetical protein